MPRIETQFDYYAILGVSSTATLDEIKKGYRVRAIEVHPDKNQGNPNATSAFQRVGEAWETLKDPEKRREYDFRWPGIRTKQQAEKSRRDAEEASRQQAAEEAKKRRKAEEDRQSRLKHLIAESTRYQGNVFEANRRAKRLTVEIARLQGLDDEDLRKEKERNSWMTYLLSPIYGRIQETEEEKQYREVERLQRVASRSIKEKELAREEGQLQRFKDLLKRTNDKIDAENKRKNDERREAEARQRAAEVKKQAEQRATEAKKQAEFEKLQSELKRAEQERRWAEMLRRQQEADQIAREQREQREREEAAAWEALKKVLETERKAKAAKEEEQRHQESFPKPPRYGTGHMDNTVRTPSCNHKKFWQRINGAQACSHCHQHQRRFVFQCPDCKMRACANCRQSLRGENKRPGRGAGRTNPGFGAGQGTYDDDLWDNLY